MKLISAQTTPLYTLALLIKNYLGICKNNVNTEYDCKILAEICLKLREQTSGGGDENFEDLLTLHE